MLTKVSKSKPRPKKKFARCGGADVPHLYVYLVCGGGGGGGGGGAPFYKDIEYCSSLPAIFSLSRQHISTLAGSMWLGLYLYS